MKIKLILLTALMLGLSNAEVKGQCPDSNAKLYLNKVQAAKNWTPTERVNSGNKVQRWTQISAWYSYNCECNQSTYTVNGVTKTRTANQAEAIRNSMNAISQTIQSNYPNAEFKPAIRNTPCGSGTQAGVSVTSGGKINNKTATQIEIENRFRNYNNAMNLKEQGESIAKAYAQQVKSYGELNSANSPEALLQNFNSNMQAIADLQTQNKADNLNQLTNTLNSTINDLNSGNYEGAMFSALSLLDQGEAKREARREAEIVKQNLIYQTQKNMTAFYWKAVDLNNQAINQYYEKAAYAYSKEEETYLLEHIENLECHKKYMETNFNYSSTAWTQNRCAVPEKRTYTVNNLIAKDIQYINAAKRKYALYEKTGEPIFQQGAMRFAGLAATVNPKTEYYYQMGHFAGTNNPLVAYSSFLTVESKNAKYFEGEKASEFTIIKTSLELYLKKAIEENNQEVIKNIVGAGLHQSLSIDGYLPIIHAIKIDQADVVFAFLNTELEGKPQNIITKKVQEVISMAAILDAPNTIRKFTDIGFSVDFTLDGTTPLDVAEEALAVKSFNKISELLGGQSKYTFNNSDIIKINKLINVGNLNDTSRVTTIYAQLGSKSKDKANLILLKMDKRSSFFAVFDANKTTVSSWATLNRTEIFTQCVRDILNRKQLDAWKYFNPKILNFEDVNLNTEDLDLFYNIWIDFTLSSDRRNKNNISLSRVSELAMESINIQNKLNGEKLPWDRSEFTSEFVLNEIKKGKRGYGMDLIAFALFTRVDYKMGKILLENYSYETDLLSPKRNYSLLLDYALSTFNTGHYWNHYKSDPIEFKQVLSKKYQTEADIINMLVFDYNIPDAFEKIMKAFITFNVEIGQNPYIKTTLDRLIDEGKVVPFKKEFIKYGQMKINEYYIDSDTKKFWKAILTGKYNKRY